MRLSSLSHLECTRCCERLPAVDEICSKSGLFACPEGAACLPAARELRRSGLLKKGDVVVLCNTGSGYKYL